MAVIALVSADEITTGVGDVVIVSASVDTGAKPVFYSPDTGRRLAAERDDLGIWTASWATSQGGDYAIRIEAPLADPVIVLVTVTADGPPAPDYYGTPLLDQAYDARDEAKVARTAAQTARTGAEVAQLAAQAARVGAEEAETSAVLIAMGDVDATLAAAVQDDQTLSGAAVAGVAGAVITTGLSTPDDTARIQSVLDNPLIRQATIPAGQVSQIVGSVTVPAGKTLVLAPGSRLVRSGASVNNVVRVAAGATLTGSGTVDGNATTTYTVAVLGDKATVSGVLIRASVYGIGCVGWSDVTVERCTFEALTSYTALFEGTYTRPVYRGNRVSGAQGVIFKGTATGGVVANNTMNMTGPTGVGIEVFGAGLSLFAITNNVVYGASSIGVSLAGATLCTVAGNTVTGATIGLENAEGASSNTFTGNTVGPGVRVDLGVGISLTTSNPVTKPMRNVTVSGNTIIGSAQYGIDCTDGQGVNIIGNTIRNAVSRAVWFRGTAMGGAVVNNVAHSDLATPVNFYRITASNMRICDNIGYATTTIAASEGLRIEGGGGGHLITGNYFSNVANGIGNNNSGTNIYEANRTVGTTGSGITLFGAATVTTRVVSHRGSIASGALVSNTGGALVGMSANNSVAATTLGAVSRKIEVFDGAGVSLGFVPVYAAIT